MTTTVSKEKLLRELDESYPVPQSAINFYREKGYVKLKQVLSADVISYYGEIITDWVFKLNKLTKKRSFRS
jgi:hypothetical protein